jgi:LDH2 family malate/lactate/ureidoglycolate dehydrogenase
MKKQTQLVSAANLAQFLTEIFRATGMVEADAAFNADALVKTNLWGVDSHGALRAPVYARRLLSGAMNPCPQIEIRRGSLGLEVLDGDDGPGFIVGRDAMQRAIQLARQYNVGAVGAIRSNHFGAAAIYARLAAEVGMVGIAMTNVMPNMVAPGGSRPVTGNNPLALAIPTYGDFPFVLDISLSNAAGGKLLLASKKGEKIPLDWATDRDGRPTDDPDEAFAGFLLPVGGHKGLALSYAVDVLSGVITGGAFQQQLKSMYAQADDPSSTGHLMMAINLEAIISREAMAARMVQFQKTVKASPMWDEDAEMLLPGELEHRTMQEREVTGIPLPQQLYEELKELGVELGVEAELAPAVESVP